MRKDYCSFGFLAVCAIIGFASPVRASEIDMESVSAVTAPPVLMTSTTGLGLITERSQGYRAQYLVGDSHNFLSNRHTRSGFRLYGFAQSRLEIGEGIGFAMAASTGIAVGRDNQRRISPHLGIELFSGRLSLHSNASRLKFYQWLPAAALGAQLQFGSCRLLPLLRAGFSIGNLTHKGILPNVRGTVGSAAYLNCAGFDLAAELSRMHEGRNPVDSGILDVAFPVLSSEWKLGIRGETLFQKERTTVSFIQEQRVILMIRTSLAR